MVQLARSAKWVAVRTQFLVFPEAERSAEEIAEAIPQPEAEMPVVDAKPLVASSLVFCPGVVGRIDDENYRKHNKNYQGQCDEV